MSLRGQVALALALLLASSGCWYQPGQIACETDANCPSGMVCDESLQHAATGWHACAELAAPDDDDAGPDDDDTATDDDDTGPDDDDTGPNDDDTAPDDDDTGPSAPLVSILAPQATASYFDGEAVLFEGTVLDPTGAPYAAPPSVTWSSSAEGSLLESTTDSAGVSSFSALLQAGPHVITLRGEPADQSSAQTSVTIEVGSVPLGVLDQDGDGFCPDGIDGDGSGQCEGAELSGGPGSQDCDDGNSAVHPSAAEICDGVPDNNCDGVVDQTDWDEDIDGFSPCEGDCDEGQPAMYPGNTEVCDGLDNDCDSALLPGGEADGDLDGTRACAGDCDDANDAVYPGAPELCDGIDNNCDGNVDEGFDLDGDNYVNDSDADCVANYPADQLDCDDANSAVHPGAYEVCNDWDDDCDGFFSEHEDPSEVLAVLPTSMGPAELVSGFNHIIHIPQLAPCPGATCPVYGGLITLCRNAQTSTGAFAAGQDDLDLFVLDYDQMGSTLGCEMSVGLANIPSGHDYGLELWRVVDLALPLADWELLGDSDNAGNAPEAFSLTATDYLDFSTDNFVVVVRSNGDWACPSAGAYTLSITGG